MSLERIKQSTSGKRRYQLRFFPRSVKTIWWTLVVHLRKKWPWPLTYDVEMQRGSCGCQDTYSWKTAAVRELSWVERKKLRRTQYSPSLPRGRQKEILNRTERHCVAVQVTSTFTQAPLVIPCEASIGTMSDKQQQQAWMVQVAYGQKASGENHTSTTRCLKKLCKIVFVISSSNVHQIW